MRAGIKYTFDANPLWLRFKKHYCPKCANRVQLSYIRKIVNSASPEAQYYDFSLGDTYLIGDVEFRRSIFYCPHCDMNISVFEMKRFEKQNKRKKKTKNSPTQK